MKEKKDINIQIGEQIKEVRETAGFTQERFSELIEVSSQYVSEVERGNVGISMSTLKKICEVMKIPADQILFGKKISSNNTSNIVERISRLEPRHFKILEEIINKYMEAVSIPPKRTTK